MTQLRERVAVVTGASAGIGTAISLALAREGARVALVARRTEVLDQLAAQLRAEGAEVLPCPTDITDQEAVERTVEQILARFGQIDILVNNAGANVIRRSLAEVSLEDWHLMMEVNLTGAFLCTQAVLPAMRSRQQGTIINIVSWVARHPSARAGAGYIASKGGLLRLNEVINLEEGHNGIRACAICPADVNTDMLARRPNPPSEADRLAMLQPEDIAHAVVFVAAMPRWVTIEEMTLRPTSL